MKEEFPTDNWYLKVTSENIDLVNDFRTSKGLVKMIEFQWEAIDYTSWGVSMNTKIREKQIQITTSQFKEFVLNIKEEPTPIINEDLTYLKDMLDKLNIK